MCFGYNNDKLYFFGNGERCKNSYSYEIQVDLSFVIAIVIIIITIIIINIICESTYLTLEAEVPDIRERSRVEELETHDNINTHQRLHLRK